MHHSWGRAARFALVGGVALAGGLLAQVAQAQANHTQPIAKPDAGSMSVAVHRQTGVIRFMGAEPAKAVALKGVSAGTPAAAAAQSALQAYAGRFGIKDAASELRQVRVREGQDKRANVRYQQLHQGVPVIGGELLVNLTADKRLISINGETSPGLKLSVKPSIGADQAQATAVAAVAKAHRLQAGQLKASAPELSIYDPRLLSPSEAPARLVWRTEVTPVGAPMPIREFVLVDAQTGAIALSFNQVHNALSLRTHSAGGTGAQPGTLLCDETQPDCTSGVNLDADMAHRYARDTYNFFLTHHGRDSYDNAGATMISTVQWNDGFNCPNAFWDGTQVVYCDGAPHADDVVAHELAHAFTERTSGLFYYFQSGAINESMSDIWGEFVDQTNSAGNDTPAVRWQIGEDWPAMGVIRDMRDPTLYSQPDRMSSPLFYTGGGDNGGVHINSGVNNKAVYLLVDGGSFNGRTVTPIGLEKTAKIYYEVQTNYLSSASDFLDLYTSLNQACVNLVGSHGITAADCDQVRNATEAVEMHLPAAGGPNLRAEACPVGDTPSNLHYSDFEGSANWNVITMAGSATWGVVNGYATSGTRALWAAPTDAVSDSAAAMASPVAVPAGAFLHFRHAYHMEYFSGAPEYYEGGVLEYSVNNGATWVDAAALHAAGAGYNGPVVADFGNPLGNRQAFAGVSTNFVGSRYNLSSLAGKAVRFRFRYGTDEAIAAPLGWVIDDVRVYTCSTGTGNSFPTANAKAGGANLTANAGEGVSLTGGGSDADGTIVAYQWVQTGGTPVTLSNAATIEASFTAPTVTSATVLTFTLVVTDDRGAVGTDTVQVTVNPAPPAPRDDDKDKPPRAGGASDLAFLLLGLLGAAALGRRRVK